MDLKDKVWGVLFLTLNRDLLSLFGLDTADLN